MKTKNLFITGCLFLLIGVYGSSFAQEEEEAQGSKREKIEQIKIAYLTKELELTTEEAEKFWPVYNELEKKLKDERKSQKTLAEELKTNMETLSDEEVKTKMDALFDSEIKLAQLHKEYHSKFANVIGQKRSAKLLSLEKQFKKELLRKLNEKPGGPRGGHPPGPPPGGPHGMHE